MKNSLIQKLNTFNHDIEQDFTAVAESDLDGQEEEKARTDEKIAANSLKFEYFDLDKINEIQFAIKNFMDYEKLVKQSK